MFTIGPESGQFQSRSSKYIRLKTSLKLRSAIVRATTKRVVVSPIGPVFKGQKSNKLLTYMYMYMCMCMYMCIYIRIHIYQFPFKTVYWIFHPCQPDDGSLGRSMM